MVLEDDCSGDVSAGDGSVGLDGVGGGSGFAVAFGVVSYNVIGDIFVDSGGEGFAGDGL